MTLSKIIYMCQLKGYEILGKEDHICLLQCVLYGLKQAGCEWYHHFYKVMHKLGFTHCQAEHAVFYKYTDEDTLIMAVDFENLTMARSSKQMILCFKDSLCKTLHIKDLGELHWLLGIEVKRDCARCTKSLSQCLYINKIVEWFSLQDAKPISTPLNPHHQLLITQCPSTPCQYKDMCNVPYHKVVGLLMYVAWGM